MKKYCIETSRLTKQYGKKLAVDNVNLHIEEGEIYGLIGSNGAGKTTIMKMLSGLASPTSGEIKLFSEEEGYRRVGVLIEDPGLYGNLNAFENLKLKALAMGVYDKEKVNEIIDFVGLNAAKMKKTKHYSLGMKQRLGLGLALIGNPDLLILDEPINGLDPQGIIEIRELILRLNREYHMTIMISSHILEELGKVATKFGIIANGKLITELSERELREKCEEKVAITTADIDLATTVLERTGVPKYTVINQETIYAYECVDRISEINKNLVNEGIEVRGITLVGTSLEEFFLDTIRKEGAK